MEIQCHVKELMYKGIVHESLSPCAVPALLISNKDVSMRIYMDNKGINKITIKYRHPLPRLKDMLDESHGCKVLCKIDL